MVVACVQEHRHIAVGDVEREVSVISHLPHRVQVVRGIPVVVQKPKLTCTSTSMMDESHIVWVVMANVRC